jgi:proteasome assembly chaperone (PAC2) family protein
MGIRLYEEPILEKPDMVIGWPGIGNIGIIAVDTLRGHTRAKEFGEVEPWDFFYPRRVKFKAGILEDLEFPGNKFYYKRLESKDLIFFIGEEQPTDGGLAYAEGGKAYHMANLVLDVAEKFGCRRVYTSGAAVALTHHALKPRVWVVTSREDLIGEMKGYQNTVLMSEVEGREGQGSITGLNGLLLGVAKKRGFEAVCLMGEIPDYLSQFPMPYPRASRSVLEVVTGVLGIEIDFSTLDGMAAHIDGIIEGIYEKFPSEIRDRIDQRKSFAQAKGETITEEDEKWIKEHIDELFKKGGRGDGRAL